MNEGASILAIGRRSPRRALLGRASRHFVVGEWIPERSRRLRLSGDPSISRSGSASTRCCSPVTWLKASMPDSRQCCRSKKACGNCWRPESRSSPVAGNHDVEALPRLAAVVDGFTLLGAGGRWEARMISKDGSPAAQVVGWSFDDRFVRQSPVAELLRAPLEAPSPPVPRIGLLHADSGRPGGHYAPIRQAEIDEAGCDAWLLGHVHQPSLDRSSTTTEGRPRGYLGSLVGLDSSETGAHGPWLLTVAGDGGMDLRQIPLAPLRWEQVAVSVEGLDHVEDLPDRLLSEAGKGPSAGSANRPCFPAPLACVCSSPGQPPAMTGSGAGLPAASGAPWGATSTARPSSSARSWTRWICRWTSRRSRRETTPRR